MRKLSVALIGCGKIAKESHLPAYRYLRDSVSLSAVCDHNVKNAEKVAGEYGIKKVYASLSEMLSGEHLDIIDICTPSQTHKAFTIQALEAGCNVLVEKPMAISSTDCDEMIQASRNTGMRLCVVHNRRFHPSFLRAQEMIGHGEVGELLDVRINDVVRYAKYFERDHWSNTQPKGPILEILPHQLYLCLALMKKVNGLSVKARKRTDLPWLLYDDYKIELEGEKFNSTIYVGQKSNSWRIDMDIIGTECSLNIDFLTSVMLCRRLRSQSIISKNLSCLYLTGQTLKEVFRTGVRIDPKRWSTTHRILIQRFVDSVAEDTRVPVPPEEGREVIRLVELIIKKINMAG